MMKKLSKPISSPGRPDKFPPPLLRFLRSNVGSRSTKGNTRSRASPMFFIRTNKKSVIETTQEPSSPKVTCIGQVRVRRNKKTTAKKPVKRRRFYWWLRKPIFCCKISPRFRVKWRPFRGFCGKWGPFRGLCGKWASFFRFGYCKKVDATEDSFRAVSCTSANNNDQKGEKTESLVIMSGNDEETKRDSFDLCSSSTPPKNALLLTRCRSAPYRSSSLGGRFWGSPVKEELGNESEESEAKLEESENHSSTSCESSVVVEVDESRSSEESGKEEMERIEKDKVVDVVEENLKGMAVVGIGSVHPLLLTRCKSEPARTGERLVPEANFWKQRRSGVVEPCSSSHHHNS